MPSEYTTVSTLPMCDIDHSHGPAAVDGKTVHGPWAYMCQACFQKIGVGLGTGRGQQLVLKGKE